MTTTPWLEAISFFPLSFGGAGRAVGDVARHGNILAFLVAVCGLPTICLHAAAYLLSPFAPFASYISGCAGGRWARLGYASWSPFTFGGVVAVLVSCSLRSVAWYATYLDPTSQVRMFSFCLCVFFLCCASPRWRVASFARSSLLCRFFVPPCLSLHTILLVRGGDDLAASRARTYGHTFLSLCERR